MLIKLLDRASADLLAASFLCHLFTQAVHTNARSYYLHKV